MKERERESERERERGRERESERERERLTSAFTGKESTGIRDAAGWTV